MLRKFLVWGVKAGAKQLMDKHPPKVAVSPIVVESDVVTEVELDQGKPGHLGKAYARTLGHGAGKGLVVLLIALGLIPTGWFNEADPVMEATRYAFAYALGDIVLSWLTRMGIDTNILRKLTGG